MISVKRALDLIASIYAIIIIAEAEMALKILKLSAFRKKTDICHEAVVAHLK